MFDFFWLRKTIAEVEQLKKRKNRARGKKKRNRKGNNWICILIRKKSSWART